MSGRAANLLPLMLLAGVACAAGGEPPRTSRVDIFRPLPWHLAIVRWELEETPPFESVAVDVTIEGEVPGSLPLYLAPIGGARLSGTPFYGGLQTRVDGKTRDDPRNVEIGRGFLFSRWGERDLDAIRTTEAGYLESSGHEGDFISVRHPFPWSKGRYTYRVVRMEAEEVAGNAHSWVGVYVREHATGTELFAGALRFPGASLVLDRRVSSFVEIYGPGGPRSVDVPHVTVTFAPPVVNGKETVLPRVEVEYPEGVPDVAHASATDGSIEIAIGPRVERSARRMTLIDRAGR